MNRDGLSKLVDELSEEEKARVITRAVDITNRSAVASFLHLTKVQFGRIDGIANLAGTAGHKLGHQEVLGMDVEDDFIMGVNVKGVFNVLSEGLKPGFLQESGSIVHAASMVAERGSSKGSVHSTSIYAGVGMVKSAALEAAKRGIRFNIVMP
jgi:NAD(P)-dependent dehydrogenase (short-subunit alcohol dehydrogenase family)